MRVHTADPSPRLEAAFVRIQREAMAGVPMLHPALRVQAVGFERWQGHWLGALVTPWFLNLVRVPGEAAGWTSVPAGGRVFRRFPAGELAFLGAEEPEVGEFQTCSLFSAMSAFPDQRAAVATACESLRLLRAPPASAAPPATAGSAAVSPPVPSIAGRRAFLFPRRATAPRA